MRPIKFLFAAAAALALPVAATGSAPSDGAAATKACATSVASAADIAVHRDEARLVLASLAQGGQQVRPMRVQANPRAEVAAVRNEARQVVMSRTTRAHDEAMKAVAAVANYQGSDPMVMNQLLMRVDRAADALHASLQRGGGGTSAVQTGAFKCNADRLECKQACSEAKGKACCCGCGVSYVACLVLG